MAPSCRSSPPAAEGAKHFRSAALATSPPSEQKSETAPAQELGGSVNASLYNREYNIQLSILKNQQH